MKIGVARCLLPRVQERDSNGARDMEKAKSDGPLIATPSQVSMTIGAFRANGQCTVASNEIPEKCVLKAFKGCTLHFLLGGLSEARLSIKITETNTFISTR